MSAGLLTAKKPIAHQVQDLREIIEERKSHYDVITRIENPEVLFQLGVLYYNESNEIAFDFFNKATKNRHFEARFYLGVMYFYAYGVEKDETKAASLFQDLAEQGHTKAQHNLGVMYLQGHGVPKDYEKGIYWLKKSADKVNSDDLDELDDLLSDF